MFAAVTLLTGINLLFIPFQPVPALWGAALAVAFILINAVADKLRLWSGVAWIIVAGIIITLMLKEKEPGGRIKSADHRFCFPRFSLVQRCAVQKRKRFSLLMFPAGITPDNCPSTLKPYVSHSYSSVSYFLSIPCFAVGVRSAVMLRTEPAALSLPGPSGSGFPS